MQPAPHGVDHGPQPARHRWGSRVAKWSLIAIGALFFGGLSVQGLTALASGAPLGWSDILQFLLPLVVFSAAGGLAVGVLVAAWGGAEGNPFRRAATLGSFLALLFALFVWPTPFKYHRGPNLEFVIRINRITGDVKYEERSRAPASTPAGMRVTPGADTLTRHD